MQPNGHLNGGARVPRSRPSPQPPHPQQQRSVTNDIDWLMTSWKSFLMILIATIILSLPILSKASPAPFDSLISQDETAPSCAVGCIESSALVAGCAQNDIACRCRISFGLDATIQDEIFGCMSRCETLDLDGYHDYATTVCQIDEAPIDERDGSITPDAVLAVELTTTTESKWGQQTKPTSFPGVPDEAFITPPQTPNQKDGMSLPAKLAIGIVIPVFVLVCIWAAMKRLKKRKTEKAKKLTVLGGSDKDTENVAGGHKAELPGGVVMTNEEKQAEKKAKKEQEKADKRPFWARKTLVQNEEVELDAQERFESPTRPVEFGQENGFVGAVTLASNQYQSHNQMYSPPSQGVAELYTPGAYPSGPCTEMDGRSPRDLHELNSAPISQVTSPAQTYTTTAPALPQQNIARALGGASPRDDSMARDLSFENTRPPQPSPVAGPVPAALDLYPQTAESDKAAIVEEERRLAAKRAAIAERKRLAEEEEQLEREEEALRRKKAAKGGQ